MEIKIIYPIITTLLMVLYVMYTLAHKPKTILDAFTRKGITILTAILYVITWIVWFFMFVII